MELTVFLEGMGPKARVAALLRDFSRLEDARERRRIMYPLSEMLLLVTCATISSCDDFDDIVAWGEHHLDFLRRFSAFHFGIPCVRWLRTLVNRPSSKLFGRRCLRNVLTAGPPRCGPIRIRSSPLTGKQRGAPMTSARA